MTTRIEPIVIEIDKPHPDPDKAAQGYVVYARSKTIGEVYDELRRRLQADGLEEEGISMLGNNRAEPWPHPYRWIACFAVTGGSEGWYVHCEVMPEGVGEHNEHTARLMFLLKTFDSMEHAYKIALACALHLGA